MLSIDAAGVESPSGDAEPRRLSADRRSTVSPLDLRQAKFSTAMRGFDRAEVTTLLREAAEGYELALRDNDRLRQDIVRLDAMLSQFRDLEGSLKSTMMTAQKMADDMREQALHEAARIVREAEGQAELTRQKAQARVDDVAREIDALRLKRREVQANLEACVSALQGTLEYVRDQEQRERHRFAATSAREVTAQIA